MRINVFHRGGRILSTKRAFAYLFVAVFAMAQAWHDWEAVKRISIAIYSFGVAALDGRVLFSEEQIDAKIDKRVRQLLNDLEQHGQFKLKKGSGEVPPSASH